MRIWLGTWNVEQQFPSAAQLTAWANHANAGPGGGLWGCDVVVMAFQECARNQGMPNIPGFNPVSHLSAPGQTKNQENCQLMYIWHSTGGAGAINHVGQQLSVTQRTLKRKIKFWAEYGKGSANNIVWYDPAPPVVAPHGGVAPPPPPPWGIVISAAHLDSKNAATRTTQVNAAENSAPTLAGGPNWDVQFLLGDLNYRVNKTGNHLLGAFCTMVATNRALLFADDSLQHDPVLGALGNWTFPPPIDGAPGPVLNLTLPTYKKHYEPGPVAIAAATAVGALPANPTTNVPLIYDLKTDNLGAVKAGSRPGQYDLGWLDRIGYRIAPGSARTVTHLYSGSLPDQILSDHSPVYSIFDIT